MENLKGKVAVVTGAASGIGRELAKRLATEGCFLAIADIDKEGLERTTSILSQITNEVTSHHVDVSQREQVYTFANQVVKKYNKVHILINNAGVKLIEKVEGMTYEDFEWVMDINFWGVVYGTKAFLPHLKKQPESHIVNISSGYGIIAVPNQSAYVASKFAVRGFTEALQQELGDRSVVVSNVLPGGVKTNIARNTRFYKERDGNRDKDRYIRHFNEFVQISPSNAAWQIVQGIKKKRNRILIGTDVKVYDFVQRLFPSLYDKILDYLRSKHPKW